MIARDYATWGEYLVALRTLPREGRTLAYGASYEEQRKWCGTGDIGEALDIAERGWPEGMAMVERVTMPVVNHVSDSVEHMETIADVTGAAFGVGEYLSGTPECWINPTHVETKPVISIGMNTMCSCGVPSKMLEMRGAAVTALTLALQASGYVVKVYAVEVAPISCYDVNEESDDRLVCHRVCLTDDNGGPLDTDRLLFALAHPSAVRALGFGLATTLAGKSIGDHVGRVNRPIPESLGWTFDFYLPPVHLYDAEWESVESVERWVRTQYEALTITK